MPEATFASWYKDWMGYRRERLTRALQNRIDRVAALRNNLREERKGENRPYHIKHYKDNLTYENAQLKKEKKDLIVIPKKLVGPISAKEVYKKIVKHPKFQNIIVDGEYLSIATSTMEDKRYGKLGRFELRLPSKDIDYIKIYNLNWRYDYLDHPHIEMGTPCFGQYGDTMYKYDTQGHLFLLINALFFYLENAHNDEDAYCAMEDWFGGREKINGSQEKKDEEGSGSSEDRW